MNIKKCPLNGVIILCLAVLSANTIADNLSGKKVYPFGRIMTTSEERQLLDEMRNNHSTQSATFSKNGSKGSSLTLSGIIIRPDGKSEIWVNQKKINENTHISGSISQSKSVDLMINISQKRAKLKVGQKWHPTDNIVTDAY